jgi:hypothetical protein
MTDYPNWFEVTAQQNFEKHLLPLAGKDRLRFLQLGVFTGDASVWMCENVLTGDNCLLTDIDTWEGSKEDLHYSMDFKDVFNTYLKKTRPYKNIHHIQWSTTRYLMRDHSYPHFDFIYIDADHTTVGVIMDAELAWPNLKSGGIMAFDDYEWGSNLPMHLRAKPGIDLFMLRHDGEYELLTKNQQVWIRKN